MTFGFFGEVAHDSLHRPELFDVVSCFVDCLRSRFGGSRRSRIAFFACRVRLLTWLLSNSGLDRFGILWSTWARSRVFLLRLTTWRRMLGFLWSNLLRSQPLPLWPVLLYRWLGLLWTNYLRSWPLPLWPAILHRRLGLVWSNWLRSRSFV